MENEVERGLTATILGDSQVGKTSIIKRFIDNEFVETILPFTESELYVKTTPGKTRLIINDADKNDTGLQSKLYRGTHVWIIVFDMTNKSSLANLENKCLKWPISKYIHTEHPPRILLVGSKEDLGKSDVSKEEIDSFCQKVNKELNVPVEYFGNVSAKTGKGIKQLFLTVEKKTEYEKKADQKEVQQSITEVLKPSLEKLKACHKPIQPIFGKPSKNQQTQTLILVNTINIVDYAINKIKQNPDMTIENSISMLKKIEEKVSTGLYNDMKLLLDNLNKNTICNYNPKVSKLGKVLEPILDQLGELITQFEKLLQSPEDNEQMSSNLS